MSLVDSIFISSGTYVECVKPNMMVTIELAYDEDSLLPIQSKSSLVLTINDAIGHHVQWPEHLVNDIDMPSFSPPKHQLSKELKGLQMEDMQKRKFKQPEAVVVFERMVKLLVDKKKDLCVKFKNGVFGYPVTTYLSFGDISCVIQFKELTQNCISMYMSYLYDAFEGDYGEVRFGFINPETILASKLEQHHLCVQMSQSLAQKLQVFQDKKFVFIAYNPGFHWTLFVLDMSNKKIFYLDSMKHPTIQPGVKEVICNGFKMWLYDSEVEFTKENGNWITVQAPKQEGSFECGYYVLRYMKQILLNPNILYQKWDKTKTYSDENLNEIRCEWTNHVSEIILNCHEKKEASE